MSEDKDILAKISQLAGQINRHKNQRNASNHQSSAASYPYPTRTSQQSSGWRSNRGVGRVRGYSRGGRTAPVHRHNTLVLNGQNPSDSGPGTGDAASLDNGSTAGDPSLHSNWVKKTDRHMQLINPAIFEKQSQQRTKAIEQTRLLKIKQRDDRERNKLHRHLQRIAGVPTIETSTVNPSPSFLNYELSVEGIKFRVTKNGSKLVKISGDESSAKATPKSAVIGGVRFFRSKHGNLFRSGIVRAQRYGSDYAKHHISSPGSNTTDNSRRKSDAVKKINEPCKAFSRKGIVSPPSRRTTSSTRGTCLKGPKCRYIHDPSKVTVCKDFLQKGSCELGDSCDLSHDLTPERTPTCLHFARGKCSNLDCRYSHVRVSPTAPVCRSFGLYGYCVKGLSCADHHVNECPDFSNTGVCKTKGCQLPHKEKASVIRKKATRTDQQDEDMSSDLSSDEDQDEIGSDDVDSDDMDEEYFFANYNGPADAEIPAQQDFVHL